LTHLAQYGRGAADRSALAAALRINRPGFMDFDSHIDQRKGWPAELRVLLEEYPRDSWRANASPLARFWIDKHGHFRHQATALKAAADAYRNERSTAPDLGAWLAPRLQSFVMELHGHHQIEDFHYFPAFRTAEPRLAAGFDVLAGDHELLHGGILDLVEATNAFFATLGAADAGSADAQRHAADRYIEVSERMYRRLARHLDDEEDLIIPVMLARGD
jgi:iron-sulfur cluster repair protein YtfE (RIC family)